MSTSAPDQPRALDISFEEDELVVNFEDGRVIHVPLEWFPRLRDASPEARRNWRLIGRGIGIHWPDLDEDLSVRGLLMPQRAGMAESGVRPELDNTEYARTTVFGVPESRPRTTRA